MSQTTFTNMEGFGPLPALMEAAGGSRSLERIFNSERVPISLAFARDAWIPLRSLMGLMERSARETGNELFGLQLGESMRPEDFGGWARYALSASDLRTAIERAIRTLSFYESVSEYGLDISGGLARWSYKIYEPMSFGRMHNIDHIMWPTLTAFRYYLGTDWTPVRVEFDYDRPLHWRRLEERFGAPLAFGRPSNAIVFESHLLKSPAIQRPPLANRVTFADLGGAVSRRSPRTILEAVRELIRVRLTEPLTDIEGVAFLLGLGPRSLQRQLSEEGLTYRDLLEQVRMERALHLISESEESITEIAFNLGYRDSSSFTRAFRRWNGSPPSQVRRANLSEVFAA